jgi:hypothetical protein
MTARSSPKLGEDSGGGSPKLEEDIGGGPQGTGVSKPMILSLAAIFISAGLNGAGNQATSVPARYDLSLTSLILSESRLVDLFLMGESGKSNVCYTSSNLSNHP